MNIKSLRNIKIETGNGTIPIITLIAIYSVSMVTSLPGLAISPILGDLQTVFKDATQLKVQLLESLPSLIIIPCVLLSGRLSVGLDKRKILLVGLGLFVASSLLYFTAGSMTELLIYSITLGIGAGMVIPLSTGLVADYFSGYRRTSQLGIVSSVANLTLVLATLLSGVLAGISWKYSFGVYGLSLISFGLAFYLKKEPSFGPSADSANIIDESTPAYIDKPSKLYTIKWTTITIPLQLMLIYFLATIIVLVIAFNLSIFITDMHIGSAAYAGTMISLFFLSIMLPGLFITKIVAYLGRNAYLTSLLMITLGIALFLVTKSLWLLSIGVISAGLGYGILQPLIYDETVSSAGSKNSTFFLALVMSMNYLAIILYPFILKVVVTIVGTKSPHLPFAFNAIIGILFIGWILYIREKADKKAIK